MNYQFFVFVAFLLGWHCQAEAQGQSGPTKVSSNVTRQIDHLKLQLRWSDEKTRQHYAAHKGEITNQIWTLSDSFVAQAYSTGSMTPEQLRSNLDAMLGNKTGDLGMAIVLPVDLPAGKFLIVGLEVGRGGGAVSEDAISFRAYGEVNRRWTLVSHVELESDNNCLVDVHALEIPGRFPGKVGLIAWATQPPLTPYKEVVRVYAFDGREFTTSWAPPPFIMVPDVPSFVTLTSAGFDLHTLTPDRERQVLQSYIVVSGEVVKSTELDVGSR